MQKNNRLVGRDRGRPHVGDERRHRFRGVDRIEKHTVVLREQPDGLEALACVDPVAFADVFLIRRELLRANLDAASEQGRGFVRNASGAAALLVFSAADRDAAQAIGRCK